MARLAQDHGSLRRLNQGREGLLSEIPRWIWGWNAFACGVMPWCFDFGNMDALGERDSCGGRSWIVFHANWKKARRQVQVRRRLRSPSSLRQEGRWRSRKNCHEIMRIKRFERNRSKPIPHFFWKLYSGIRLNEGTLEWSFPQQHKGFDFVSKNTLCCSLPTYCPCCLLFFKCGCLVSGNGYQSGIYRRIFRKRPIKILFSS